MPDRRPDAARVLLLAPTDADADLSRSILGEAGLECVPCAGLTDLVVRLDERTGVVLVTEEVLADPHLDDLIAALERQPSWSDVPVVLLSGLSTQGPTVPALERLGNVIVLDRPVRVTTLVSALHTAVRARLRQFELRDQLNARALHAAIVESSDDAMISKTPEGTILSWNPGAERMLGYTAREAIGQSIMIIVPPELRVEEVAVLARLQEGQAVEHYETVRWAKDGRRVQVSLSVSPLRDEHGRVTGASSVARDITEQKRAEQMLRGRGERLRLLWESAAVLLTADEPRLMMQSIFTRIAPQFALDTYINCTITEMGEGFRLESSAGFELDDARRLVASLGDDPACHTALEELRPIALERIGSGGDAGTERLRALGLQSWLLLPLVIDERAIGLLAFGSRSRDRFGEDELEFLQTIAHYVTATYARIGLIEQLRDADRRTDEFLATLAHELRNPLAPIRNALTILRLRGADVPGVSEARRLMERQLEQMVRLIDDLLDVSRITRGRLELRRERIDLRAVLASAVDTARPIIDAAGHHLEIEVPDTPIALDGDPIRLAQVFSNLLNNAAKYMDRGGRIWLSARTQDGYAEVAVRDSGIGIPPEALPMIFEMFTQLGDSGDRTQGGLGIGLTLARRLLEMHGGEIEARSRGVGHGAEFVARLPVAAPVAETWPVAESPLSVEPAAGKCRILVADDNIDSAESMALMLRLMGGNEVRAVHDGLQAVEEAAAFRPDLVLLDIGMPRLNGYEAAARIRSEPWGRHMFLVALTGWGQEEDRRRSHEAGFNRHFTKPVDPAEIAILVADLQQPRPGMEV